MKDQNLIVLEEKKQGLKLGKACLNHLRAGYGLCFNYILLGLVAGPAVLLVIYKMFIMSWVAAPAGQQGLASWQMELALLSPLVVLSGGVGGLLVVQTCLKISSTLHNSVLERVVRAPMSFFVSHPLGRILNRFSKDTAVVDTVLVRQSLFIFQVGEPFLTQQIFFSGALTFLALWVFPKILFLMILLVIIFGFMIWLV